MEGENKNTQQESNTQQQNKIVILINSAQGIIYISKYFNNAETYVKKTNAPLVEWEAIVGSVDDLREVLNRFDYDLEIVTATEMKSMLTYLADLVQD
jgi:hypothetical protein